MVLLNLLWEKMCLVCLTRAFGHNSEIEKGSWFGEDEMKITMTRSGWLLFTLINAIISITAFYLATTIR